MDVLAYLKENYELTELLHAHRFNGVIDVYKKGNTIFVIPENLYLQYKNDEEFSDIAINFLEHYPPRPAFKKLPTGRMAYQEFKHHHRMDHKKTKRPTMKDDDVMPFGMHKGKKLANVPADYLIWLFENDKCFGQLLNYIRHNEQNLRQEIANKKKGIR
jgi:uncharacterized protein (DUF3820 family)